MPLDDTMTPIDIPQRPNALPLGTGRLPDATADEAWHGQYGSVFARNVVEATLEPFLPDPDRATGAAVLVAPGGGFRTLSMENEGWHVAEALAARGVAAFVLKYRLNQTPADMAGFERVMAELFSGAPRPRVDIAESSANLAPQLDDVRAAFDVIRGGDYGVDADRVGMVGFSAGAMLTLATALAAPETTPAFIGNIYGPISHVEAPQDAPPLFVALAADDPFFAHDGFGLVQAWTEAGRPVEFHLYEQGGHGFGMYDKPTTSTGWLDAFANWLRMHGAL